MNLFCARAARFAMLTGFPPNSRSTCPMSARRPAKIISGPVVAESIRAELRADIAALAANGVQPGLAVVLVGADPASEVYVRSKRKTCEELGIASFSHDLPADCTERKLLGLIA